MSLTTWTSRSISTTAQQRDGVGLDWWPPLWNPKGKSWLSTFFALGQIDLNLNGARYLKLTLDSFIDTCVLIFNKNVVCFVHSINHPATGPNCDSGTPMEIPGEFDSDVSIMYTYSVTFEVGLPPIWTKHIWSTYLKISNKLHVAIRVRHKMNMFVCMDFAVTLHPFFPPGKQFNQVGL